MNDTIENHIDSHNLMFGGVTIGLALGQLKSRQPDFNAAYSFSSLLKALLALRDKQMLSDSEFSDLVEAACVALIDKQVSLAIDKVIDHQINVNMLTKLLSK